MSRAPHTPLLLALIVCIMVVAGGMFAVIFISSQKSVVVILPPAQAPAALGEATPAAPAAGTAAAPAAKPVEITILRMAAVPALENIADPAWDKIPATEIPLQPQQTTSPTLEKATVLALQVQAIHDDKRAAWRISWPAAGPATQVETGAFTDAVAIQFPMVDGAPFTMGAKGQPVRLLHWKAIWQKDIDSGFQDITDLYPNAWCDLYWFAPGLGRISAAQLGSDPKARAFMSHLAAGNPMANTHRKQPVEEIVAEGFGSATSVPDSPSTAHGVWKDGRWTVVLDRPLNPADPLAARLRSHPQNLVSFAVWDGTAGNRGGRKQYCTWIPLRFEP